LAPAADRSKPTANRRSEEAAVETRQVGTSGLRVTGIGVGCNNFGSRLDQAQTQAVVDAAIEAGINLFDTADVYGGTQSEVFLGKALGGRRQDVVLATKFGSAGLDRRYEGASRHWITRAVEASLKRLGADYIDLYQVHTPDRRTPIDETLRAMDDLVRQGKVLYIGCSNVPGWRIADAAWTARAGGLERFVSVQNAYSLLERGAQAEALPACEAFGLGFLPYFPLAAGLLTGKYQRGAPLPEGARITTGGANYQKRLTDRNFDHVEALTAWAQERGHSLLELAFAWLLAQPVISSVIAGASSPAQLRANAACAAWKLTPQDMTDINALLEA